MQCGVFYQSSIFFFFAFKSERKTYPIFCFRTELFLPTLPFLWGFSHMFIFFVPCCIHSRVQTKSKQINFNVFSGKNKSTTGKAFLMKAFY